MTTTDKPHDPTQVGSPADLSGGAPLMAAKAPLPRRFAGGIARASRDTASDVLAGLDDAVPAFGNVLLSIGDGVASSQEALDQGVIDTINELSKTNITVVTDVVQVLGDDGLPDASQTVINKQDVSLLNFFTPTMHEWKNVSVSMDLSVSSFHQDQGLKFSQSQHSESVVETGLFWGFLGWFDSDTVDRSSSSSSERSNDVAWQSGQIRVDAQLGPRTTGKLPVPANVAIGPQLYVSEGAVHEEKNGNVVTARSVDIEIQVRKANGDANPSQNISLQSAGLLPSFPNGSATDPNGVVKVTLKRTIVAGFSAPVRFQLTVSLGQLRKPFNVTL
jgi:hypothetical protein